MSTIPQDIDAEKNSNKAASSESSKPPVKALLMGYYGARNLGDDMMLFCLRHWLNAQGIQITVLGEIPQEVHQRFQVPAVQNVPLLGEWAWYDVWFRGKALRLLQIMKSHDALIVGGGDLIRDDRGWRPFLYTLEKLMLMILLGKPTYLVNTGIGRPQTWYGRKLLRWTLRRCKKIIVRDQRSYDLCRELGAGGHTEYAPDIVMTLPSLVESQAAPAAKERSYVVVSLRTQANVFHQFDLNETRLQNLARALDQLAEQQNAEIVFLPFQSTDYEQDHQIHERVAAVMEQKDRVVLREWTGDFAELLALIGGAKLVIGMRLHAVILGVALRIPSVLMPYDHKLREFATQVSLPDELTAETLDCADETVAVLTRAYRRALFIPAQLPPADWATITLASPVVPV